MRRLSLKLLCSTGVILLAFLSVLMLNFNHEKYESTHSFVLSRQQKSVNKVLHSEDLQIIEHSGRPSDTESIELEGNCSNTTTNSVTEDNKIQNRFKDRSNVLLTVCHTTKVRETKTECDETDVKRNLKYSPATKTVYCAIEKTGSTFWKRILFIIGGKSNISNPTDIKPLKAEYSEDSFEDMSEKHWSEIEEIFETSKTIMFVRDPYARLFSAWLDKFYSPNVMYWNSTARIIAKSQRQRVEKCVSDISFSEFVNHTVEQILSESVCIDRHFSPNYKHCNPCHLRFDYIGKYETMKEDTLFILDNLNLTNKVKFTDFEDDAAENAIKDAADWVFYQKDKIPECGLTFQCALFRVWQRLQSRGFISCKISFPFSLTENTITQDDFETELRKAHRKTVPEEAINIRKGALRQAITSLPENVRKMVIEAFRRDFDMFGYDHEISIPEWDDDINKNTYFSNCPTDI